MAKTYEPIATTTLGGSGTFSFTNIPNTYTDLRLIVRSIGTAATYTGRLRFNGTSSTYSDTVLYGNGSSAGSSKVTGDTCLTPGGWASSAGTLPILITYDIFSYTASVYKTTLMTFNNDKNGSGSVEYSVGLWLSTSAITQIDFIDTVASGSVATLYGIKAA